MLCFFKNDEPVDGGPSLSTEVYQIDTSEAIGILGLPTPSFFFHTQNSYRHRGASLKLPAPRAALPGNVEGNFRAGFGVAIFFYPAFWGLARRLAFPPFPVAKLSSHHYPLDGWSLKPSLSLEYGAVEVLTSKPDKGRKPISLLEEGVRDYCENHFSFGLSQQSSGLRRILFELSRIVIRP